MTRANAPGRIAATRLKAMAGNKVRLPQRLEGMPLGMLRLLPSCIGRFGVASRTFWMVAAAARGGVGSPWLAGAFVESSQSSQSSQRCCTFGDVNLTPANKHRALQESNNNFETSNNQQRIGHMYCYSVLLVPWYTELHVYMQTRELAQTYCSCTCIRGFRSGPEQHYY